MLLVKRSLDVIREAEVGFRMSCGLAVRIGVVVRVRVRLESKPKPSE